MLSSSAARAVSPSASIPLALRRLFAFCGLLLGGVAFAQTTPPPEPIVITFTNMDLARTYTGLDQEPATWTISPGTPENYVISVTYNDKAALPKNAGEYTVKVTATEKVIATGLKAKRKVTFKAPQKLVVAKAPLTVRAAPAQKFYGSSNPKLTFAYEGFLNGETFAVLNTKPNATTTVKTASPAGVYAGAITVVGGSDNNYVITERIPADFTVARFVSGTHEVFILGDFGDSPAGKITITLPTSGNAFTGSLNLGEETASHAFSGKLVLAADSLTATYTARVNRAPATTPATTPYYYDIGVTVDIETGLSVTLDKSDGDSWEMGSVGKVRVHAATTNPAPWAGAHTFSLHHPDSVIPLFPFPEGDGYATAGIGANGNLTLKGKLSDGTALTGTLYSDAGGGYRVYLRPYGARVESYFSGFLQLVPHPTLTSPQRYHIPNQGESTSTVYWRKQEKTTGTLDKTYPSGFEEVFISPALDPWIPPAAGKKATSATLAVDPIILAQRLGLVATHTETALFKIDYGLSYFGDRDNAGEIAYYATLAPNNAIRSYLPLSDNPRTPNPAKWTFSVNQSNGTFTGSFSLLDTVFGIAKPVTRNVKIEGILRQRPGGDESTVFGAGFLLLESLPVPGSTDRDPPVSEPVRFSPFELP